MRGGYCRRLRDEDGGLGENSCGDRKGDRMEEAYAGGVGKREDPGRSSSVAFCIPSIVSNEAAGLIICGQARRASTAV